MGPYSWFYTLMYGLVLYCSVLYCSFRKDPAAKMVLSYQTLLITFLTKNVRY